MAFYNRNDVGSQADSKNSKVPTNAEALDPLDAAQFVGLLCRRWGGSP